ncbi:MAG TPA: ECF transporter S component [candidate division Zixibacteria bacterium]|nr:ECF transporter S component [candidate division Zixibacteria bacterium]
MTATTMDRNEGTWSITTRTIVYAAIGAALYAAANWTTFAIQIPGTENVSLRPQFALVTFFGFAFGPIVGFLTGFVGNVVGDQLTGWGAFTSWPWSLANGAAGLLAGVFGTMWARREGTGGLIVSVAIAAVLATVLGFLLIFIELITQPELGFNTILTAEYIPTVLTNSVAAAILTPILVLAWEPLREQLGR